MDVGVDLKAKYAIMWPKTVLISENDEESIHSALRQHFHLQQRHFQRNERNDDAQAFQYL